MTVFDYLVLLVLGCSILISIMRGLVKEVLSLLSWIISFVMANAYGEALAQMLPEVIAGTMLRLVVGFMVLLLGTRLVMALCSRAVETMIRATGLTLADRGLGSLFGLARGMVFVMIGVLLCGMTDIPQQPFWKNALLSPLAETAAWEIHPYLPGDLARYVKF